MTPSVGRTRPERDSGAVALALRGIRKVFADSGTVAVASIDLEIPAGEIMALVGPSGCGKTTILNLLAGFETATAGRVEVGGAELDGLNRRSSTVFQTDSVFPWMTVEGNVRYGLANGDDAAGGQIVDRYVRAVSLDAFRSQWPRQLSVGMRKRVELARAYASAASVLLLDEPFGALDVLTKEEMQLLLLDLWARERRTLVFATHDVEEALFLAHRVVVLTARPARVFSVMDVPFGFPREPDLKLSPAFLARRMETLGALREAARRGDS